MSVALTLQAIEAMAPDQGALTAAGKLRKPAQWARLSHDASTGTIWGECQGSGANPYRVVADVQDHGYKCTCPSRKFPCKHSLALMWMFVEGPERFVAEPVADWVGDWLGRRRRGGAGKPEATQGDAPPARSIEAATVGPLVADTVQDEAMRVRNEASAAKRRQQTDASIRAGMDDLQQWLSDQLRSGMAVFVDDAMARCRRIAARLVDAKAAVLASRVDELPSRLLAVMPTQRPQAALHELGQLVLLMQAWRADPDDPDARIAVVQSPAREALLADARTLHVPGPWEVLGTEIETRRDGLVSQSTWLRHRNDAGRFALLQDFFPGSAGRRNAAFSAGQDLAATLSFHHARHPLRAVLNTAAVPDEQQAVSGAVMPADDPLQPHRVHLSRVPWALRTPLVLPAGRIGRDSEGRDWWLPEGQGSALPLTALDAEAPWRGMDISAAVAIWDGFQARMLRLDTAHGVAYPNG